MPYDASRLHRDNVLKVAERHRLNEVVYRRTKADACTADGSPLFARRWVHTESFTMSAAEKAFYAKLREYLIDGFDLAKQQGNQGRALGFVMTSNELIFDASFGVHALFAVVASALVVFNSLAIDVNLPFSGVFRLESGTVAASLKNLRSATAPYLDEPPLAPSQVSALYAED